MRAMVRLSLLFLVVTLALTQGCLLEWVDYFTKLSQTNSAGDPHRVRDLRVLAMEAQPAELRIPLEAYDDDHEASRVDLQVTAYAYDPRGGEVEAGFRLCLLPRLASFGGGENVVESSTCLETGDVDNLPAAVAASLVPPSRVVTADSPATGGRLQGLEHTFHLDDAALRLLLEKAGGDASHLRGFELVLGLQVSRVWLGERETEWAVLRLPAGPDLGDAANPALLQAFLDDEQAELCDPEAPRDCVDPVIVERFPPNEGGPLSGDAQCGDGFVEQNEQCDPPLDGECTEECQIANLCERTCAFALPRNERPFVYGFDRIDEAQPFTLPRFSAASDAALHDGDVITLSPGDALGLLAVVDEASVQQQTYPHGGDAVFDEYLQPRWYAFGPHGDFSEPRDFDGNFEGGTSAAVVYQSSAEGHSLGDREPVVLVTADDRGGMTVVTLELAFE